MFLRLVFYNVQLLFRASGYITRIICIPLCCLSLSGNVQAVLTSSTAKVIVGTKPVLVNPDKITANLSFTLSAKNYKASDSSYTSALLLPATSKLSDFKVNALQATDFSIASNYVDDDGDTILSTNEFTAKAPTYRWLDRTGAVIPAASYNQTIGGCTTTIKPPLTLEISTTVGVSSSYGMPRTSDSVAIKQKYTIQAPAQICFLRPNSLEWVGSTGWGTGTETSIAGRGGGFNKATFSKNNGFLPSSKFPTTGFKGAQFKLTMDRNDYTYKVTAGSGVTVDANGLVSLNSKPSGTVTIRAQDKTLASRYVDRSFTISNWVVPKPNKGTYAQMLALCGNNAANIVAATVLTNSPQKGLTANPPPENYFTRDVGTVFSEWGQTIKQKYTNSDWQAEWTNVPYYQAKTASSGRYAVSSLSGPVIMSTLTNTGGYIVCKG